MKREVVITGIGPVSSVGTGKKNFWENIAGGVSGISEITRFDTKRFSRHYAGEIKKFDFNQFFPGEKFSMIGRASRFAAAGVKLALEDAGIPLPSLKNKECALLLGTTLGEGNDYDECSESFVHNQESKIDVQSLARAFLPSINISISKLFDLSGVNTLLPNACAAGNYAICRGFDLIREGRADLAITGGTEALSRISFQGFQSLRSMDENKCSPFDKNRKGLLLGEGAGILILEPMETAIKRKARIYAKILGYGLSCDAYNMTIPNKRGIRQAIETALVNSNMPPGEIDYISAHGTGTVQNDKAESGTVRGIFYERGNKVPMSSIKSMIGHSLGAASGLESIVCCLAIRDNLIPPTINFTEPDPECEIDCVPNKARPANIKTVLNNSFAFGGNNCCVVFQRSKH